MIHLGSTCMGRNAHVETIRVATDLHQLVFDHGHQSWIGRNRMMISQALSIPLTDHFVGEIWMPEPLECKLLQSLLTRAAAGLFSRITTREKQKTLGS